MTFETDPSLPWRLPTPVIVLLSLTVAMLTLAGLGFVAALVIGNVMPGATGFDLKYPDGLTGRIVWIQSSITLLSMLIIWILSILVIAAHGMGNHRAAAGSAIILARITVVILVVRYVMNSSIPIAMAGDWSAGLVPIAAGMPMIFAEVALLVAADFHFQTIRQNAAP